MNFKTATDRLLEYGITLDEIAAEAGVSDSTIRKARLDPSSAGYRSPPVSWRKSLRKLALRRGGDLEELAAELKETSDG